MAWYKTPLNIQYNEKDIAKQFGAKWDNENKQWYMFHFSDWRDYKTIHYKTNIPNDAFESLLKVNNIAKSLNKDIFDIIPQYKNDIQSLSNILTTYACQHGGIEDASDVLYHPKTYFDDLREQYDKYKELSESCEGISPENTAFLRKQFSTVSNAYQKILESYDEFEIEQSAEQTVQKQIRSRKEKKMEKAEVYLNTWRGYNGGYEGFGWMRPEKAIDFIKESLEDRDFVSRFGEEIFISDIMLPEEFHSDGINYMNAMRVCEGLKLFEEDLNKEQQKKAIAIMEYEGMNLEGLKDAADNVDCYICYTSLDEYYNECDNSIKNELNKCSAVIRNNFNYNSFHKECEQYVNVCENGIVIEGKGNFIKYER